MSQSRGRGQLRRLLTADSVALSVLPGIGPASGTKGSKVIGSRLGSVTGNVYGTTTRNDCKAFVEICSVDISKGHSSGSSTRGLDHKRGVSATSVTPTGDDCMNANNSVTACTLDPNLRIRRTKSASGYGIDGQQPAGDHHSHHGQAGSGIELQGSSATFRNVPWTTTRLSEPPLVEGHQPNTRPTRVSAYFPCDINKAVSLKAPPFNTVKSILMPEITFDEVLTEPSTPEEGGESQKTNSDLTNDKTNGEDKMRILCDSGRRSSNYLQAIASPGQGNEGSKSGSASPRRSVITLTQSPVEFRESTFSINYSYAAAGKLFVLLRFKIK